MVLYGNNDTYIYGNGMLWYDFYYFQNFYFYSKEVSTEYRYWSTTYVHKVGLISLIN